MAKLKTSTKKASKISARIEKLNQLDAHPALNTCAYKNNSNLKPAGIRYPMTKEHIEEIRKCSDDPIYFIKNYVKIVNVDKGVIPFDLYDYQEQMVLNYKNNRYNITLTGRQQGKTCTTAAFFVWYVLFHHKTLCAILANKAEMAQEIIFMFQEMYEQLPKWMQQGVVDWNKRSVTLENKARIMASATSSSAIRGKSVSILYLDEFGFVPHNMAVEFFNSVFPTISSGQTTKVIITSTPNGIGNLFHKMWLDAEDGRSQYVPLRVHWHQVPGRDEKWKKEMIANTSELQFAQEHEAQFLGSAKTLIDPNTIQQLGWVMPSYHKDGLRVYKGPEREHQYVMTVDTAEGVLGDYSAFTVIDVTTNPYEIVAVYQSNTISPMIFPNIILKTLMQYNDAYVLVETNSVGQTVASILWHDLEYENMLTAEPRGRRGMVLNFMPIKGNLGVKTTKQTKSIGCSNIKSIVEEDGLIVNDASVVKEMSTFVAKGKSWEAEEGNSDDLMMCLVLFGWLTAQQMFESLTDQNTRDRLYSERMQAIEMEALPDIYINDGAADDDLSFVEDGDRWFVVK